MSGCLVVNLCVNLVCDLRLASGGKTILCVMCDVGFELHGSRAMKFEIWGIGSGMERRMGFAFLILGLILILSFSLSSKDKEETRIGMQDADTLYFW